MEGQPEVTFQHGLNKFKAAFAQLRAIRRWGAEDRVRDTGLLESWAERLAVVGQSVSTLPVEVELWYRRDAAQRQAADSHLTALARYCMGPGGTRWPGALRCCGAGGEALDQA